MSASAGESPSRIASTVGTEESRPFIFQLPATSGRRPSLAMASRFSVSRSRTYNVSGGPSRASLGAQTTFAIVRRPSRPCPAPFPAPGRHALCAAAPIVYRGARICSPPVRAGTLEI
ncbi:protein of unknown function [Methylorubrum extorquens]|uniref:Uncharacterized protein n=1 Tax=Methylorubrum extorquens TaxID=408 RepID=A0A2N9AIS4_METEX|nr:protein of unknown function [Methylorubrum extorquens]